VRVLLTGSTIGSQHVGYHVSAFSTCLLPFYIDHNTRCSLTSISLAWHSYLSSRSFRVRCSGSLSSPHNSLYGVPPRLCSRSFTIHPVYHPL